VAAMSKGVEKSKSKGAATNMTKEPNHTPQVTGRDKPTSADLLGPNSEIGRKLKQYYDDLVSDDVPDRFADLLSQLEHAQPKVMADAPEPENKG
jgi:hypothetical protein